MYAKWIWFGKGKRLMKKWVGVDLKLMSHGLKALHRSSASKHYLLVEIPDKKNQQISQNMF